MMIKNKRMQNRGTLHNTIIKGMIAAVIIVVLGAMLMTTFVLAGSLDENNILIGTVILLFISAGIGSLLISKMLLEKKLVCIMIYVCSLVVVLILLNTFMFDGAFINVLPKITAVLAGGMLGLVRQVKRNHRKIITRSR